MQEKAKDITLDILVDILAGTLIAAGTYNFAAASEFPLVGFNGIGLILYHLFGLPIGTVAILLNIPVAIVCYRILGKEFFKKSLVTIFISSMIIDFVAPMFPVYHGEKILAAVCTGTISGIGYALLYMRGSSSGGTDFIMLSIKALHPHMSLGKISFAMETVVIVAGTVLVSKNVDGLIYGMVISFIISIVIDKVMYGLSSGKMALIVTDKAPEVAARIDKVVGRGSTLLKGKGSYSGKDKEVVMSACNNKQMFAIKEAVKEIDPYAFMVIMESSEVFGAGFKEKKM